MIKMPCLNIWNEELILIYISRKLKESNPELNQSYRTCLVSRLVIRKAVISKDISFIYN